MSGSVVPISVFPEMKLLFPKQNYNVLSPSSYTHISVTDLYISRIGLPILLQENMWTEIVHRHMNVEIFGTEAARFPEKEYINGILSQYGVNYILRSGTINLATEFNPSFLQPQ
jgi:hypothetical protein